MNSEVLKKYNISFLKDKNGNKFPDGKTVLSSYLFTWRNTDDIDDFLVDVNYCLDGDFSSVEDCYYNDSLRGIYGELTSTDLILYGEERVNPTSIPLIDFKEILLSWKDFLLQ